MSSNILYKIEKYKFKYNQTTSNIKKKEYRNKLSFYQKQLQIGGFDVSRFTDHELAARIEGDSELGRRLDIVFPKGAGEAEVKRYLNLMEGDIRNVDDAVSELNRAVRELKDKYERLLEDNDELVEENEELIKDNKNCKGREETFKERVNDLEDFITRLPGKDLLESHEKYRDRMMDLAGISPKGVGLTYMGN
jgi:FtsZ-binding cell division protein ZapB